MELEELLKPETKDVEKLKKKMDEVNEIVQKMSTELYQKAAQEQAAKQQASGKGKSASEESGEEDNVVDADYEVKDDKKKKK
jgi:molecular chaperone DnaK